jgi:hypothetical protein
MVRLAPRSQWDVAATSNKQNFLDTPTSFIRANSISDVPCSPVLTLGWITFTAPIFFDGLALDNGGAILDRGGVPLDRGGTILDGVTRLIPVFTFFAAGFFHTSAFRLSLVAREASIAGKRARGISHPHLLKNTIKTTSIWELHHHKFIILCQTEAPQESLSLSFNLGQNVNNLSQIPVLQETTVAGSRFSTQESC